MPKAENKFSDPRLREIYDHQDQRDVSSLIRHLSDKAELYREQACLGLASVQDAATLGPLAERLLDQSATVRLAAAYALGQLRTETTAEVLFLALEKNQTETVRSELLEALGKCVGAERLSHFISYEPIDSKARAGFAWGLYRAGSRGLATADMVASAAGLIGKKESYETRLGAAHFLCHAEAIGPDYQDTILNGALTDTSPDVRMALAFSMRHADEDFATKALVEINARDTDYRVKVSCIRTLQTFSNDLATQEVTALLNADDHNICQAAAWFLVTRLDKKELVAKALETPHWLVRAILLGGATADRSSGAAEHCIGRLTTAGPYEKSALLYALASDTRSFDLLVREAFQANTPVVRTTAIEGIARIREAEELTTDMELAIGEIFKQAVEHGDMGMVITGSTGLARSEWNYKAQFPVHQFLYDARDRLVLPKDTSTLKSLNAAIDYFEGADSSTPVDNNRSHPINWDFVAGIDADLLVKVLTSKGAMELRMLVNDAPGSVAHFMALADAGYYDHRFFHRSVPNFVTQGGGPRGDGLGGFHSIRSELGPSRHRTGCVGMAAPNKDSEGVQWFVTHRPLPHLDGAFSTFAVVHSGMDVVRQLEVGDKILSIERTT